MSLHFFAGLIWDKQTPDDDGDSATRDLSYRGRFKDIGSNVNLISFFLPEDYATKMPWEVNNDQAKPESGAFTGSYRYIPKNPNGKKLYRYKWDVGIDPMGNPLQRQVVDYYLTGKPYEAMAHACSTWGKALGAQNVAHGAIDPNKSVDLSNPIYVLPDEDYPGFGDEHNGQFNANIQNLKPFYDTFLERLGIEPNP